MDTKITDKDIINAGYKEFTKNRFHADDIEKCFQKRFDDDTGKRYFIDIYKWRALEHPFTKEVWGPSYEFEAYFETNEDEALKLQFYAGWSIEKVESYVKQLFDTGLFKYYERWDEC